jgi:tetratricopeptide (TPR) repeat protein
MAIYDAFISYSHAKDKPIAAALQSAIQKLGKPWYKRRALRVFRDDTSLSATPHLWPTIERALGESRFLLLLASPEAAASHWVGKEIAYWLETKSTDTLLIAVTDGTLTWDNTANDFAWRQDTPLPGALKGRFASEPKWVDLTAYRDGADKGDAKFTELAADFASAIRGMPKEDLLSQEVRQQRRALTLAWSAAASLFILLGAATAAGILAYRAQQEAVAQRNRAEQTLEAATDTANRLVTDLAVRFRSTIGVPYALIKDILDRARALQDQLIGRGETSPQLRRSQAGALNTISETLIVLGDTNGSLTAAQQAETILLALLATEPANAEWRRALAYSDMLIGDALQKTGDLERALAPYRDAIAMLTQLAAKDPDNIVLQTQFAMTFGHMGETLRAQGKSDDALASYRAASDIVESS